MSRFCFFNCPAGFSADPERHAPDCPGRSGAGKARTPAPATLTASQPVDSGVDFGIDGRSVRVSQEAYSIFLAREAAGREKIAALQQRLTAADERTDVLETALKKISIRCEAYIEAEQTMPEPSVEVCQMIASAALKPAYGPAPTTCSWSSHEFSWESTCGMTGWEFTDGGTPGENGMRFCHSCGKTLVVEGEGDDD